MKPFTALAPRLALVPASWRVARLRDISRLIEEEDTGSTSTMLSLSSNGQLTLRTSESKQEPSAAYREKFHRVAHGDLVVNPMWLAGGGLGVAFRSGAVSPEYRVYRFGREMEPRFVHHLFRSAPYLAQYKLLIRADTTFDRRVTKDDFRELPVAIPPTSQQRAIADFLNRETARIDALIAAKRRMIEVLAARTESLIASILDPLIAEFGETPLKTVAELRVSNVDKKSYEGEVPVQLCNYVDVYRNRTISRSLAFMEATASADQAARLGLKHGDVLITKDSETANDIAVPALVTEDLPGVVLGYHLAMLRPTRISGSFVCWALRSRRCRDAFSLAASGVTRFGLRQDAVGRVPVPLLRADLARSVVERIETSTDAADSATTALVGQIELLVEHRQALITAAVTGELNVGVAA